MLIGGSGKRDGLVGGRGSFKGSAQGPKQGQKVFKKPPPRARVSSIYNIRPDKQFLRPCPLCLRFLEIPLCVKSEIVRLGGRAKPSVDTSNRGSIGGREVVGILGGGWVDVRGGVGVVVNEVRLVGYGSPDRCRLTYAATSSIILELSGSFVGMVHSHVGSDSTGRPSQVDCTEFYNCGFVHVIYCMRLQEMRAWVFDRAVPVEIEIVSR